MHRERIGNCNHVDRYDLRNFKGRVFFATDIHGHFDLLHAALRDAAFSGETDILFVGGDLCDRGPDSQYVLDYVTEPWFISVRGNHCQMFIDAFESHWHPQDRNVLTLKAHGGNWIWSLDDLTKILIHDVFKGMPLGIELLFPWGKIGIVHAEVPYNDWDQFVNITKTELEWNGQATAQWARKWYSSGYEGTVKNIDYVLCGHTPTDSGEVEQLGNMVFADGGSFFNNKINLIELDRKWLEGLK